MSFTSNASGTKGAIAAPLFFLGAAVAAWGSAEPSPVIWAVSLVCLGVPLAPLWTTRWTITPLALAVWAYAGWTLFHTALLSRAYNPAGLSDPLFLLAGFAIGRAFTRDQRVGCYGAACILAVGLGIWAVIQLAFGAGRGHAHFETGNTLASVLNGILAPLVVALLYGGGRQLQILTATLFAGVWATFSRGGAIALVMGLVVAIAVAGLPRSSWRRLPKIGLLFVIGGAVVALASVASNWLPRWAEQGAVVALSLDSVKSRLELYELAWSTTVFGWGIGYLAFRYVLELGRADVPSFGETSLTYFVHNDYLQTLLELGVPGFAALLAMVVLAVRATMRAAPAREGKRWEASAILAGVLTYAFHAMIDFPLHLPIGLLLFGLGLGAVDRLSAPGIDRHAPAGQAQRLVTLVLVIGLAVLLARPVMAEVAAAYAMKKWMVGETRAAAFGFELARRADPRDWRYHLYAGQFWFAQAAESKEPEHARLADTAFAAGMAANLLDSSNALGRAVTHLTYRSLLAAPAQSTIIRAWAEQALSVAPRNPAVRKEYEYIIKRLPPQ